MNIVTPYRTARTLSGPSWLRYQGSCRVRCHDRCLRRFVFDPGLSQVWIDGSSSIHPVRATATGVTGWIALALSDDGIPDAAGLAGEVRIAVDRLASGNRLIDQETKRRINATRHPEIVGTVTAARRVTS